MLTLLLACAPTLPDTDTTPVTETDLTDLLTPPTLSSTSILLVREGEATVLGDYQGTETLKAVDDEGDGATVCAISYALASTATRADCPNCVWAFDLLSSAAAITVGDEASCLDLFGLGVDSVSDLDGDTPAYGFDPDYVGHDEVLMVDIGGWAPVSQAAWDDATGALTYAWIDGVVTR